MGGHNKTVESSESSALLQAVQRASRTLARSGNFDTLLKDVLAICVEAVGAQGGTIYLHDAAKRSLRFQHVLPESVADLIQFMDMPNDQGVAGQVFQSGHTQISNFEDYPARVPNEFEVKTGVFVNSMVTVPLSMEDEEPIGVVQLVNKMEGSFTEQDVTVLDTVAAVCTMGFLNSKLVEESSRASTLLGMGKVGHDIGNLASSLFATQALGEMAIDSLATGIDGKHEEALHSLRETQDHLKRSINRIVGYSRLISDLSANRELRPSMEIAAIHETVRDAAAFLENDARMNCVQVVYDIDETVPLMLMDELYIFRIVQNLVGNAIKAVRETIADDKLSMAIEGSQFGTVTVRNRFDNGHIIEVQDTGPGMKPEIVERILVGTARSQWDKGGGSGWGTKIVIELAHSHGGCLEIDSAPGLGSTFRVRFPR